MTKPKEQTPLDRVISIEQRRMRLGIKKKDICTVAQIKREMYSYVLKRGHDNKSLPEECLSKICSALTRLEEKGQKKKSA